MSILEVKALNVGKDEPQGISHALRDIHLTLKPGRIFGLMGESGAGKTLLARSLSGLLRPPFRVISGRIRINGEDIPLTDRRVWQRIRGREIFMIFQSSSLALNPLMPISQQVAEVFTDIKGSGKKVALDQAGELLEQVGLRRAHARQYPHQISGGMRQRVQIAVALALSPRLLIADEPTTGLDPITQTQILDLLARVVKRRSMALILISHDLRAVARIAEYIGILDHGRLVESGPIRQLLGHAPSDHVKQLLNDLAFLEARQ